MGTRGVGWTESSQEPAIPGTSGSGVAVVETPGHDRSAATRRKRGKSCSNGRRYKMSAPNIVSPKLIRP